MKSVALDVQSILFKETFFALIQKGSNLSLSIVSEENLRVIEDLVVLPGVEGHLLFEDSGRVLFSVDNQLILYEHKLCKVVFNGNSDVIFWHGVQFNGSYIVQEYGPEKSCIYCSTDLVSWKKIICNFQLDKYSRHFHDIRFDKYRKQLIATLGDNNYVRVVASYDLTNWRVLYKGPWQFFPIFPTEHNIVFGMDSSIATGGIGILNSKHPGWKFIFLKWTNSRLNRGQMCSLEKINERLWITILANPQAILSSRDLKNWSLVYSESFSNRQFLRNIGWAYRHDVVMFCIGNKLLSFKTEELEKKTEGEPIFTIQNSYKERLVGAGSLMKRIIKKNLERKSALF